MKLETIAIHAGNKIETGSRAVIQPITLSTTYERGADGDYPGGFIYTRADNPNRKSLENVLAQLERGADACAFSSGNAAGNAVFQSLKAGSHIIAPEDMYHGLKNQLKEIYAQTLEIDFVDCTDTEKIRSAIKSNTRLIWIETPSNPLLKITDIAEVVTLAKKNNIIVACDNTFASPVFQNPLVLGCDIVMHSSTKYIGGHSDVCGGALICKELNPFWEKVRNVQTLGGAIPSPFDCFLTVRGIKTLPYRMRGHEENAMKIALFLEDHPAVEKVYYPGLISHPQHKIAKNQMNGFGGIISFLVNGTDQAALKVVNKVKLFTQATSLGGVESLIEHRASIEGPETKTPQNLIRASIGLENSDDLIADLNQALQ
ncbi:trans-sulfuration enzyme family protein [Daejeonella oryzae]|uniref:trans-sulfuration enzyme family protein n=1 Tax=Daejeonella oryzae TaxID=1122943 RepID=UPI000423CDF7|nr:aminotransferase class V-fold PLP-dependent enzyme [Daejeonella oryzae]